MKTGKELLMQIGIVNFTKERIDKKYFQKIGNIILKKLKQAQSAEVSLVFVGDARMKGLNSKYRGKDKTTDVLSFPNFPQEPLGRLDGKLRTRRSRKAAKADINLEDFLGEIVISIPQTKKQAKERGYPLKRELSELFAHGILHLAGYDDKKEKDYGEMMKKQEEIIKLLGK